MGSSAGKLEVTKFTKCQIFVVNSGIQEFDKVALLIGDLVETAEVIRFNVQNSRECLFRITKTHLFNESTLLDTFKVWTWAVGACNEGSLAKVQFKVDYNDYDHPTQKQDQKNDLIQEVKKGLMSGFGAMMDLGKKAVQVVSDVVQGTTTVDGPKIAMAVLGNCGDFRLEVYPKILQNYIINIKLARDFFPALEARLKYLVARLISMKDNYKDLLALLDGTTSVEKALIVGKIGANLAQFDRAHKVMEKFRTFVPGYLKEIDDLIAGHAEVFAHGEATAHQVFSNDGIRPYYNDPVLKVLKVKLQSVSCYLGYAQDDLLVEANFKLKEDRKGRRPKAKGDQKFNDVDAEETVFPCRYRWIDSKYFDTQFSAMSISLSELENARKLGGEAKKQMFKMTHAGKFKEKTVASAFEVWTWACSLSKHGHLAGVEMVLLDAEPWIGGKQIEKVKFDSEAEQFRKHLIVWLHAYAPSKYQRLQGEWADLKVRDANINANKFDIIEHTKDLHPSDVYNALTSLEKNLLCNKAYMARSTPLYTEITQVQGEMGLDLFRRQAQYLAEADTVGAQCKGSKMKDMAILHVKGKIADEHDVKQRKAASQKIKEERARRKHFWN